MTQSETRVRVTAFGQSARLAAPDIPRTTALCNRLTALFEPHIGSIVLPVTGTLTDIGADFGSFAIPFARAFPEWRITCFEPRAQWRAALLKNINTHRLGNMQVSDTLPMGIADVVKLTAPPQMEAELWDRLPGNIDVALFGQLTEVRPSTALFAGSTPADVWLPVRGAPLLALRRDARRPLGMIDGLDRIPAEPSGMQLNRILTTSNKTHIGFGDGTEQLLECARYTGAEVTAGPGATLLNAKWVDGMPTSGPMVIRRDFLDYHRIQFSDPNPVSSLLDLCGKFVDRHMRLDT